MSSALADKRREFMVGIRKDAIQSMMEARRRKLMGLGPKNDSPMDYTPLSKSQFLEKFIRLKEDLERQQSDTYLSILTNIQVLMSANPNEAPVNEFIESGLLPYVFHFLTKPYYQCREHLFQALWICANAASGGSIVVEMMIAKNYLELLEGILEAFKKVIPSDLFEILLHGLANMVGNRIETRDQVLKHKCFQLCLEIYQSGKFSLEADYLFTWLCSNLSYGPPFPSFEEASALASICCQNLNKYELGAHSHLETEAIWGISYYLEGVQMKDQKISNIYHSNTMRRIVQMAVKASAGADAVVIRPILRILANMFSGPNDIIESLLDQDLVQALTTFSKSKMQTLAKDAFWAISNVMAGSTRTVSMMATHQLFDWLGQALIIASTDVKIEVCYVLKNYFSVANSEHIEIILGQHTEIMQLLLVTLEDKDSHEMNKAALQTIRSLLSIGEVMSSINNGLNPVREHLQTLAAITNLERLQFSASNSVATMAHGILEDYFNTEVSNY